MSPNERADSPTEWKDRSVGRYRSGGRSEDGAAAATGIATAADRAAGLERQAAQGRQPLQYGADPGTPDGLVLDSRLGWAAVPPADRVSPRFTPPVSTPSPGLGRVHCACRGSRLPAALYSMLAQLARATAEGKVQGLRIETVRGGDTRQWPGKSRLGALAFLERPSQRMDQSGGARPSVCGRGGPTGRRPIEFPEAGRRPAGDAWALGSDYIRQCDFALQFRATAHGWPPSTSRQWWEAPCRSS